MSFYKYASFSLIFLILSSAYLYSQENNSVIASIEVIGLRRTKPHAVVSLLEVFIGTERADLDQNEVIAVIINTGILEHISTELIEDDNGLLLQVTANEKLTIFPIPLIMISSGGTNFGLGLLDRNAFGIRDMMAIGGAYGSFGWVATAMYSHTPRHNYPGWNIMFMYSHLEKEDVDKYENVHRRYAMEQLRISLGVNYLFMDLFTGSFSVSFININLKNTDNILNPPGNDAAILEFNPGISLRKNNWDGFFLSQQSISLRYGYNYAISGSSFHKAEYRFTYDQPLIPGFRLIIKSGGIWKSITGDNSTDPLFEEGPNNGQVSILPRDYSARHYAGFSAGLEKYLLKFRFGILSLHGSWQGVFSDGPISGSDFNHGPSGGINFYLSRLALPGIGANISYNINSGLFQFGFNAGISF